MKKCAFLTMDSLEDFVCYDHLLIDPLSNAGWKVEDVSWRDTNHDWSAYDAVIIRSTWDYQDDYEKFLEVLRRIDKQSRLENPLKLVEWNLNKAYLKDLEELGTEIVPTILQKGIPGNKLYSFYETFESREIIIKPAVSANAGDTYRIKKEMLTDMEDILRGKFNNRNCLIQPFMPAIIDEGEYSLFYFGGEYSHCILKKPVPGDFRVQEEHGGMILLFEPEDSLKKAGASVMEKLNPHPLYGRADFVRAQNGRFQLMELELIEPSLYFNMDKKAIQRFVSAFVQLLD